MGAIPTDPGARRAYFAALGRLGGLATYHKLGSAWMSIIGKEGFRIALELGWGDWLWQTKFSLTYEAKFGRTRLITVSPQRLAEIRRLRDRARRRYRNLGCCAWPGCRRAATQRHHAYGLRVPDANDHVIGYCAAHHKAVERAKRQAHREARTTKKSA